MNNEIESQYQITSEDYDIYLRYCSVFTRRYTNIPEVSLEVVLSDALIYTLDKLNTSRSKFSSFLYFNMINGIRKWYRDNCDITITQLGADDLITDDHNKDVLNSISRVVEQLTPLESTIFHLWVGGESYNRIGEILDMSRYRVANIFNSTLVQLRAKVWGIV
jgi:DNA-directed RNA polymerase specialized sigma24 family protein